MEEGKGFEEVIQAACSVYKETKREVDFVREVESSEGSISNEAFEKAFNIKICSDNSDNVEVSQNDTEMMNYCCSCNLLVYKKFNNILQCVHGCNVDHDLWVLLVF